MNDEDRRLFRQSVQLIERLCRETERLSKDVRRLSGRIEPFEGETDPPDLKYYCQPSNFREVIQLIQQTREAIRNCEYELNKTTARIDQIVSDGWSREELKPFLKE